MARSALDYARDRARRWQRREEIARAKLLVGVSVRRPVERRDRNPFGLGGKVQVNRLPLPGQLRKHRFEASALAPRA